MVMRFEQSSKDTLATFLPANGDLQELWMADNLEKALLPNLHYLEARAEFQHEKTSRFCFNFLLFACPYLSHLICAEQVNNIPMNGLAERFLTMLSACRSLSTIKASNCGLKGTVPNLGNLAVKVNGKIYTGWISPLSGSLQILDLGANHISEVSGLPIKLQSLSLAKMNTGVHFQKGVLHDASSKKILLDLSELRLMNSSEAAVMLQHEELRSTSQFTMIDKTNGFQCKDLEGSSLRVTPHMFLPNQLCQCLVGWIGTGAACQKCPKDTFRDAEVPPTANACTPCPLNSTSKEASSKLTDCQCKFKLGHLFQMGEEWRCGCQPGHALVVEDVCERCELLHLDCMESGSQASTAPAKEGYARLAPREPRVFKCYPPLERCNATRSGVRDEVGCNKGYSGILCSECAATYRKDGDRCKECPKNLNSRWFIWVGLVGLILVVLGLAVAFRRRAEVQHVAPPSAIEAAKDLAMAQAPILLQSCQLWPVLAHLARSVKTDTMEPSEMWWMKYIEVLQFSAETFKGSLNLQCHHDGRTVRFMFAVLGPVLPLLVMMVCISLEKFQKGAGLRTSLKILTLTYIGGAAACSNLLVCQSFDASGIELPESFIFRKHLPNIKCIGGDASMRFYVDTVAYATGLFYAIVIPGFLAYLFAKTQFILRPARTSVAVASDRHELKVSMSKIRDSADLERDVAERRLVASTMAYIAVVVRGLVRIQLLRAWFRHLQAFFSQVLFQLFQSIISIHPFLKGFRSVRQQAWLCFWNVSDFIADRLVSIGNIFWFNFFKTDSVNIDDSTLKPFVLLAKLFALKNSVSQGDELTIHVKPVEGQSHRLDQADFLSFFEWFFSKIRIAYIPCKFQARISWDTLDFIFLGRVGMQTCLKIDFDWPLHDPHTLYSTIYRFTLVLPTFWQDGLESADSFDLPFAMEEVAVATTLKCRSISEMLVERCILEEVEDSDRILAGAKQLLLKYAQGSYLCMEILLKLAAVAVVTLVQTVQDESAVKLCMGVTLATAATIGLAQPYLQPQLNSLQVVCFTSLSVSGLGFACGQVWLSQIALFLPFIVAGWQLMTPDSSQSLAVRLWNEAKKQIPKMQKGEEIEVMAETFTFRWWDPKRSRHPTFCRWAKKKERVKRPKRSLKRETVQKHIVSVHCRRMSMWRIQQSGIAWCYCMALFVVFRWFFAGLERNAVRTAVYRKHRRLQWCWPRLQVELPYVSWIFLICHACCWWMHHDFNKRRKRFGKAYELWSCSRRVIQCTVHFTWLCKSCTVYFPILVLQATQLCSKCRGVIW